MITTSIQIQSDCGHYMFWALEREDKKYEPSLQLLSDTSQPTPNKIRDCDYDLWDSSDWLLHFFKNLKKGKETDKVHELRKHCDYMSWNFEEEKVILLEIFKESKKLNFWKYV